MEKCSLFVPIVLLTQYSWNKTPNRTSVDIEKVPIQQLCFKFSLQISALHVLRQFLHESKCPKLTKDKEDHIIEKKILPKRVFGYFLLAQLSRRSY